jgi:hypothetical protein
MAWYLVKHSHDFMKLYYGLLLQALNFYFSDSYFNNGKEGNVVPGLTWIRRQENVPCA